MRNPNADHNPTLTFDALNWKLTHTG